MQFLKNLKLVDTHFYHEDTILRANQIILKSQHCNIIAMCNASNIAPVLDSFANWNIVVALFD